MNWFIFIILNHQSFVILLHQLKSPYPVTVTAATVTDGTLRCNFGMEPLMPFQERGRSWMSVLANIFLKYHSLWSASFCVDANIQTRKSKKVSLLWWNYQKQIESTPRKKNHASRIKTKTNTQLKEWGFQNQHHQNPQKPAKTGLFSERYTNLCHAWLRWWFCVRIPIGFKIFNFRSCCRQVRADELMKSQGKWWGPLQMEGP